MVAMTPRLKAQSESFVDLAVTGTPIVNMEIQMGGKSKMLPDVQSPVANSLTFTSVSLVGVVADISGN